MGGLYELERGGVWAALLSASLPHTDHINSERFSNKEKALCNIG